MIYITRSIKVFVLCVSLPNSGHVPKLLTISEVDLHNQLVAATMYAATMHAATMYAATMYAATMHAATMYAATSFEVCHYLFHTYSFFCNDIAIFFLYAG